MAPPPRGAVVQYTAVLHGITRQLDDAIHAELVSLGVVPRRDAADGSGGPVNPGAIAARIQRIAERIVGSKDFLRSLANIAGVVQSFSREQFQRQVRAAIGVDLPAAEPAFHGIIHGFRQQNTALIKTLADDKVSRVRRVLFEAGSSTRVEDIAARLQEETGITDRHAALIARDQVLKLNGAITAKRHADAGITTYIWRTSRDGRVREGHRELEGTRQDPKNPPVVFVPPPGSRQKERQANPGQDFQCRCTMEPVIEGFDDDVPVGGREAGTSSPISWSPVHGTVEATFKRHGYEPPARLIPPPLAVQHPTARDVDALRNRLLQTPAADRSVVASVSPMRSTTLPPLPPHHGKVPWPPRSAPPNGTGGGGGGGSGGGGGGGDDDDRKRKPRTTFHPPHGLPDNPPPWHHDDLPRPPGILDDSDDPIAGRSKEERATIRDLIGEGNEVRTNPRRNDRREGDTFIHGSRTELKHPKPGAVAKTLKNEIDKAIKGQSQGRNIIIDARRSGLTEAAADAGVELAARYTRGKVDYVRVIGIGFDKTYHRFR